MQFPPEVIQVLNAVYKTGKVGEINMRAADYDEDEADEYLKMLRLAASKQPGCRLRIQRNQQVGKIFFEMVDIVRRGARG